MNDAQTWTVIGLFFTIFLTMVGMVLRIVRTEIQSLRDTITARLDAIDRDVQRLYEHWFGERS